MNRLLPLLFILLASFEIQAQCDVSVENFTVNCNGDINGQLEAVATGTAPFNYIWSNGSISPINANLSAGTYTVTVTDALNCVTTGSGMVTEPTLIRSSILSSDVLCNGDCDGALDLTATGGTPPYTYAWSDGASTEDRSGLCAGTYSVTITDANGCTEVVDGTVNEPVDLVVDVQDVELSCTGNELAVLTADVTGGTPSYTFQWIDGQTTQSLVTTQPGTYIVTVTDANGCSRTAEGTISFGTALNLGLEVENLDCQSGTAFQVTAFNQMDEGQRQYDFAWSGPGVDGAMATGNTDVRSNLGPGTYYVTITDEPNGCVGTDSVVVMTPQQPLSVTSEANRPACFGECNGFLDLEITGGNAPYTYNWPRPNGGGPRNRNLCPGTQSVTITDSYGCTLVHEYNIGESDELTFVLTTVDETCAGDCDGRISVEINGGTAPYAHAWSNGQTDGEAIGLCPGVYTVTITDANGCSNSAEATINGVDALMIDVTTSGGDCDPDGGPLSVDITVTGGTPPYNYAWSDGSGLPMIPEDAGFRDYGLTVTDVNGCFSTVNRVRNYNFIEDNQAVRLPRQTCQGPLIYNAPIPDGWSQAIILPNGDTISGTDFSLTEFGPYRYLGFSPDNTCLQRGSFTIFSVDLVNDFPVSIVELDSVNCGAFNCLRVSGLPFFSTNLDPFLISWFGPDGTLIEAGNGTEICNFPTAGTYTAEIIAGCDTVVRSILVEAPLPCSAIIGNIYAEETVNCQFDQDDLAAPGVVIEFTDVATGAIFYEISDAFGGFLALLPIGTYSVTPIQNGSIPDDGCAPIMVTTDVTIPQTVELFHPAITNCPAMETWICMFRQRRCFENSMTVYYYNSTAEAVDDVVVTVEMDPFYTDITTSIPIAQQVGQILTFNIGTVQPFQRT